jgi:hypothetical protein
MTEQQEENLPITAEILLAAILKTVGTIEVHVEDLIADYSDYQVEVNQEKDNYVNFSLVSGVENAS